MLRPDDHALLTSALRPPAGFALDRAVGTTFTLDLVALMLTQLTFATHDMGTDVDKVAPIALLDALTRNARVTTVFVHGGGIGVPAKYRPLFALLEDSIVEVTAPGGGIFHPKLWALRFRSPVGALHHRVLVLSRNLTFDRSWDTMLRLDQAGPDSRAARLGGAGFAAFLRELPAMAKPGTAPDVEDLARTLEAVDFELPAPYDDATVWALGNGRRFEPGWQAWNGLLISPFLARGVVDDIARCVSTLKVVSTASSLDQVGNPPTNTTFYTLNPVVDAEAGAYEAGEHGEPSPEEARVLLRGLHAKVLVLEDWHGARTFTGSANATWAGFGQNVEINVELRGRNGPAGIGAVWTTNGKDDLGLEALVTEYDPKQPDPAEQLREDLEWDLTHYQNLLASLGVTTTIAPLGEDTFTLTVNVPDHGHRSAEGRDITTTLRPLTLSAEARPLAPRLAWGPLSLAALTPYVVATSRVAEAGMTVQSSCVLATTLVGDVPDRRDRVLRKVLEDANILAYLALLLTGPATEGDSSGLLEALSRADAVGVGREADLPPIVLFEPLVRAAVGDGDAIARVASLVGELRRLGEDERLPKGFLDLWQVALAASGSLS